LPSSPEASWHADYRDTAYIYIGGLPFELSEGDIITIFSQFGEPNYINLVRDKETGKSRGFAFLKYEDQRSTDLAVDNLGGTVIMGRTLKVDHTRYKKKDDDPDEGIHLNETSEQIEEDDEDIRRKRRRSSESEEERPMLKEERELFKLIQNHDEDDPMKGFLIEEKKEEVALALARVKNGKRPEKSHKHRHHHKSRRSRGEGEERDHTCYSRCRSEDREKRSRSTSPARRTDSRKGRVRDSGYRTERTENLQSQKYSPSGYSRGLSDREGNSDRPRKRTDSIDHGRHYSRRDS
jgi:RNA-binding motif X-linked protein 2